MFAFGSLKRDSPKVSSWNNSPFAELISNVYFGPSQLSSCRLAFGGVTSVQPFGGAITARPEIAESCHLADAYLVRNCGVAQTGLCPTCNAGHEAWQDANGAKEKQA